MAFFQRLSLSKTPTILCIFSLFFLSTTHHHQASIISKPISIELNSNPSNDVHQLLTKFGFPKGLLPDSVKSYSLSENGDFKLELNSPCYVHFDYLTYYDKKITGKLKYGSISDITGIQAKKLFLWVTINEIEVDYDSNSIEFHVGILSHKLPLDQFQEIPSCKNKACHKSNHGDLISEVKGGNPII